MHGALEPTNESYAIAKIAGIKLCEAYNRQHGTDFRSVMPTNLYGPNDSFHAENSHVIPAMIRKLHEAKLQGRASVEFWGSGNARREFLHVDDMAAACIHVLGLAKPIYDSHTEPMFSHINLGSGIDVTIRELADILTQVTAYEGDIVWDESKPDGMPRKLLDVTKLRSLGWQHCVSLESGLKQTYRWYTENEACLRK
jgi:GDP-L-fucose synthase